MCIVCVTKNEKSRRTENVVSRGGQEPQDELVQPIMGGKPQTLCLLCGGNNNSNSNH